MSSSKKLEHVNRRLTEEERARHDAVRAAAHNDIPPKAETTARPAPPGIPAKIRQARETRGLTWYALAQQAGLADSATVRDIERGNDVKLSDLQAVAAALGLQLDVTEQPV